MQPEIRAIIFDMDGLMLDTEPFYKAAWQAAAAELDHQIDDRFYGRLVGRPTADCEQELVGQFGPDFRSTDFARAGQRSGRRKLPLMAFSTNLAC